MPEEEYEWERSVPHWGVGSPQPVTRDEFYRAIERVEKKMDILHDAIRENEDRLMEERAKHFLFDLVATGAGRLILLAVTIVITLIASNRYDFP